MRNVYIFLLSGCLGIAGFGGALSGQEINREDDPVLQFPDKLLKGIDAKQSSLSKQLTIRTEKYLRRLSKREQKIRKALFKVDSSAAKRLFDKEGATYAGWANEIKNASKLDVGAAKGMYLPYLDSLKGSLKFLDKNKQLLSGSKNMDKLHSSLEGVNQLQARLQQSEQIRVFISERKQQIKEVLKEYSDLPKAVTKNYGEFSKEVYYYGAQVREYKEMLNDPSRMERKALELLNKVPAFTAFMQKNSFLGGLFSVPANYGSAASLAGLQTRDQVQQVIGNQLASGGPSAQSVLQENLQSAQSQLSQLKDKINQLGGGSGDTEMPDFKPRQEKTKSFLKRLEYRTNI